jgi:hypothetical protein
VAKHFIFRDMMAKGYLDVFDKKRPLLESPDKAYFHILTTPVF